MTEKKINYDRSFIAKLLQTSDENKNYYRSIVNYFKSHKKVNKRTSWSYESITWGRQTIARITLRGKTLNLYLALEPKSFEESKYFFDDVSDVKTFEKTPMKVKVKSKRGLKYALELIEILAKMNDIIFDKEVDLELDLDYKSDEDLLNESLIKMRKSASKKADIEEDEKISLKPEEKETEELEAVERLFVTKDKMIEMPSHLNASVLRPRHKEIVNLETLELSFESYEVVSLETLINKGLVSQYCDYVKILGLGKLTKPILVIASSYSKKAFQTIIKASGKPVLLK